MGLSGIDLLDQKDWGTVRQYGLVFLEDPFHERDFAAWQNLTATQKCRVIGDNLYSSDAGFEFDHFAVGDIFKPIYIGNAVSGL